MKNSGQYFERPRDSHNKEQFDAHHKPVEEQ